jgi:hypothetical protein
MLVLLLHGTKILTIQIRSFALQKTAYPWGMKEKKHFRSNFQDIYLRGEPLILGKYTVSKKRKFMHHLQVLGLK